MRLVLIVAGATLAGCTPEALVQVAYPGAVTFSYRAEAYDSVNTYSCLPKGPGGATAEARAKATHRYVVAEVTRFAKAQAGLMASDPDAEDEDALIDRITTETDRRFKCLMVNTQDL